MTFLGLLGRYLFVFIVIRHSGPAAATPRCSSDRGLR